MSEATSKEQLTPLQRAVLALKEMRARLDALERAQTEPIAVIGMACRFPGGVSTPAAFWRFLCAGADARREWPRDRWDMDSYYDPDPDRPGKIYVRHGYFLDEIDRFDPQFFGISPREAHRLDPQQRLLLELAWEALEHAGLPPDRLVGSRTGVFVGIGQNDFAQLQLNGGDPARVTALDGTGNGFCFAAGRLSYVLGLNGPNLAVDTACSSSLVAVHLACQSLRAGESDLILAGGVQLILSPEVTLFLSRAKALSPEGRCKTFDVSADGYARGEGGGMVILKRLADAVRDGDRILALIRGSAVNHDGRSSGLTVPNLQAQESVIRDALHHARLSPVGMDFLETHGTGTALGDPIEVKALAAALCDGRSPDHRLWLGAVKANIGHLEAAAGIAGLIKVVLCLQHRQIPPQLHFKTPNPRIPWDTLPIGIPTHLQPWPDHAKSHLAGLSSFGISGTNAHVILEEAPVLSTEPPVCDRPVHVLTLSAKTDSSLR